ncbi:putative transporter PB10D8.04c/PB10D8.05c/PB10D8.06c/PB10D8.07c [Yarrowia sp. B02]|nr:putative transporter PB10D8.04c/PB10D8.05c/PB10D8.06c/PB10D8.07c [Yarrowia sp. B02]
MDLEMAPAPTTSSQETQGKGFSQTGSSHDTPAKNDRPHMSYLMFRIKYFSPAWFASVMGVGVSGGILYTFPFHARWLEILGEVIWAISLGMLGVFSAMFLARFAFFPRQFMKMLRHPGQSTFIGCVPMAFCTTINMIHNIWGQDAWLACYILWWFNVVMSLCTCWGVAVSMFFLHKRTPQMLNCTMLLPIVSVVVCAATGTLFWDNIPHHLQGLQLVVCIMLWANGQCLAFAFVTVYIWRLLSIGMVPPALVISNFLPVGPLGQGSFGILLMSSAAQKYLLRQFPNEALDAEIVGQLTHTASRVVFTQFYEFLGIFVALFLQGFAFFWLFVAFTCLIYTPPKQFSIAWWGLTFPLGTFALGTARMGYELDSLAFRILSSIAGVMVCLFTLTCALGSIRDGLLGDKIFVAAQDETDPLDQ